MVMSNTGGSKALIVIERLRNHFATLAHHSDKLAPFSVTFSAGLAVVPVYPTARELLLAADRARYQAKERGRNCALLSSTAPA